MSTVNKYNYEAVLLDFAEGRLSSKETNDLFDFLAAHPELQEDFDAALEMISVDDATEFSFSKKDELLQDETNDFEQNLIIAHVEGVASQLDTEKLQALQKLNPALEKELLVFSKLKMEADTQLVFSKKNDLLQEKTVRFSAWLYRTTYAAAAVLLLFVLVTALNSSKQENFTALAKLKVKQLNLNQGDNDTQTPNRSIEVPQYVDIVAPKNSNAASPNNRKKTTKIFDGSTDALATNENLDREIKETFELLPIRDAAALDYTVQSQLAVVASPIKEPTPQETEVKFNSGLFDYLAEQSPRLQTSYGFAGDLSDKLKSFTGDFQNVDEIELKIWGMRTTIRKPSWMKWRRQKVKTE